MKNQGISLISLIITIIVIIILAAIVIFTGLGTPDSANFAKFCQDCDNVGAQVLNKFAELKVNHATRRETRTDEQIYMEVALGSDTNQYAGMDADADGFTSGDDDGNVASGDQCQRIKESSLNLPLVRETNEAWYVTENGQVFNATGYYYDGNTYFNATIKTSGERAVAAKNSDAAKERSYAKTIAGHIIAGDTSF